MPITPARDRHAPNYQILVDGKILTNKVTDFISSVEYEDNSEMMDKIVISIDTQTITEKGQTNDLIDSRLFSEGNLIEVFMGYGSSLKSVGAGEILKVEPNFPRDSIPTLTVTCYDTIHRLTGAKVESFRGVRYRGQTDSAIVSTIAFRNSLTIGNNVDTKLIRTRLQEKGKSDYEFLRFLAKENSYELYVRYIDKRWNLFFEPYQNREDVTYTFKYNMTQNPNDNTLLEFSPNMNTSDQATEYEFIGFDRFKNKKIKTIIRGDKKFKYEPTRLDDILDITVRQFSGNEKLGPIVDEVDEPSLIRFKAFGLYREIIKDPSIRKENQAEKAVRNWIDERKKHFVTGSGSVIGVEYLQSRQVHKLLGIGASLSGDYYFTVVTHKMTNDSNYECTFSCRKVIK